MGEKKPLSKNHDLRIRTLINGFSTLVIAFLIFVAEIHYLRWLFATAVAGLAATAVWEFDQILKKKEIVPAVLLSMLSVIVYVFAVFIKTQGPYEHLSTFWEHTPEIVLCLAFFGCFLFSAFLKLSPITHVSTTFFGILYIGIPLGLFVRIIFFFIYDGKPDPYFEGSWWIIYLIAVTKSADIGGFFIGRKFGRRKLAYKLSPNKTLEGAIGGLIFSICISLFICFLGKQFGHVFEKFSYVSALWLGCIIGLFGQIGDLAESFFKRDALVKDSNTIPGVGGILDMIDSLLFTAPIVYIFLRIFYT